MKQIEFLTSLTALGLTFAAGLSFACSKASEPRVDAQVSNQQPLNSNCRLGDECCPDGYTTVTLTPNPDSHVSTNGYQCIQGLGGSDQLVAYGRTNVVLGGDGDENIMANASVVRGGAGRDTIHAYVDPDRGDVDSVRVYGGSGDDTITASIGDDLIVPGAGSDTIDASDGDDLVEVYDVCELSGFTKSLDGGAGNDTLRLPVAQKDLGSYALTIRNFENVEYQRLNACASECSVKPDCGSNGACQQDQTTGTLSCRCNPGLDGPKCEQICDSPLDSDQDGTLDCSDDCPYNAAKTAPGRCGCHSEDADSDSDGTYDCDDRCPRDPNNIAPGDCGCMGQTADPSFLGQTVAPAGTPCAAVCPGQADATCNGEGVCGDPAACRPEPNCKVLIEGGTTYWVCESSKTFAAAAETCEAKGLKLARIDTFAENERVQAQIDFDSWLGGTALGGPGVWRWSHDGSGTEQFYAGNPGGGGREYAGRFHFWTATNRPGSGECLVMRAEDGRWYDDDCSAHRPYVCEYSPGERFAALPTAPIPDRFPIPLSTECVPPGTTGPGLLPASTAEYLAQGDSGTGNMAERVDAGSRCAVKKEAESCAFKSAGNPCDSDADCSVGQVCGQENTNCPDPDAGAGSDGRHPTCTTRNVCGVRECPATPDDSDCAQVDYCPEPNVTFDAGLNEPPPATTSFTPASLFREAEPEAVDHFEEATGVREDGTHRSCSMQSMNPAGVRETQGPADVGPKTSGNDSGDTKVKFEFDPNIVFTAKANPLAFGESNLHLHAEAGITASVGLTLLGKSYGPAPILSARAKLVAQRCSVSTSGTELQVFDEDFIAGMLGGSLETDDLMGTDAALSRSYSLGERCEQAVRDYQVAADRVKKAYRDAEQLVKGYKLLQQGQRTFSGNLCKSLGIPALGAVGYFPGGDACPEGEPAELTINRFIRFYQDGPGNQVDALRGGAAMLSKYSRELLTALAKRLNPGITGIPSSRVFPVPFANITRSEARNVFRSRFAIGPVPMSVEVDIVAAYGLRGGLEAELNLPTNLGPNRGNMANENSPLPEDIARVKVSAEPYAAAGLSLYAAADVGVASAGIEGALSLARVSAPIHAGAGLGVAATADPRQPPAELDTYALKTVLDGVPQVVYPFGRGVRYRFYASYDYGAAIVLSDVMSGEVNAKARARFFGYSRTWRKRMFKYNGWGDTYRLLHGGGATELFSIPAGSRISKANGQASMGSSQPETPIVKLAYLERDPVAPPALADGEFDTETLGGMFYDKACCAQDTNPCGNPGMAACCPGLSCLPRYTDYGEPVYTYEGERAYSCGHEGT